MLIPEDKPDTDLIMVATGTGIAPYRSFIRRIFTEKTPFAKDYTGLAWLFLGVANSDALLYDDEWQAIKEAYPNNFRLDYALSREQTNKKGGKMYIQDKVEEYSEEIFTRMDNGAHMYFCGLKGMMPGITGMLESVCKSKNIDFEEKLKEWKKGGQWHVEVRAPPPPARRPSAARPPAPRPCARTRLTAAPAPRSAGLLNAFYGRGEWRAPALYCQRAHAAARAVRGALAGPGGFC